MLESYVTKSRDKSAALTFIEKALKRYGSPDAITSDGLRSYRAAMNDLGYAEKQEVSRWANNRVENTHLRSDKKEGHAALQADEDAAEVCLGPRQRPQPFSLSAISPTDRLTGRFAALAEWQILVSEAAIFRDRGASGGERFASDQQHRHIAVASS